MSWLKGIIISGLVTERERERRNISCRIVGGKGIRLFSFERRLGTRSSSSGICFLWVLDLKSLIHSPGIEVLLYHIHALLTLLPSIYLE